ncbi:MAG: class I SAM-dependent methyltransferase [Candidatus Paceibacterota bacterium]|jgi:23S rRNA (cytosine1962-C5)-methyltransferase
MKDIKIWTGEMGGYKLLDSGNKQKLEEINGVKIVRNEPRAWWQKNDARIWNHELCKKELETVVDIGIGGIKAKIKFKNTSKHIGIFPEQFPQWKWIEERIMNYELRSMNEKEGKEKKELNILNLFGYTGIASLVAAKAGLSREASAKWGAKVTHVDASKPSVDWARENQKLSGLQDAPIRWIVDDVIKFIKKEAKNGKKYDAIIMDPPSYGKGPKDEVWKIEEQLPELLQACRAILSENPLFIIFNMYSTELSSISVANLLSEITKDLGACPLTPERSNGGRGNIEVGELAINQQNLKLLPMSIFAIWINYKY